ncbi:MAG: hypothetical protein HC840_00735 [Leptolyngbyaceae cyanobacterium RM2_2_4]|nr:hypothetical protein [Leptolyngbyaceae cyanobacterium RM2_2_4]
MGRQVADVYARRSAFEQNFAPERQRAAQQSLETMRANQTADKMSTGFGLLKNLGVGMAGGAAAGGAIGALGMGVGAVPGAIIGGGLGLGKGILDIMGDDRKRSMVMSPFSDTAKKRYGSILAEDMVNDYTTSYEGQKNRIRSRRQLLENMNRIGSVTYSLKELWVLRMKDSMVKMDF